METPVIVEAEKAVQFQCWSCKHFNYDSYTLEDDWIDGAACMSDILMCEQCGVDNKVVERF